MLKLQHTGFITEEEYLQGELASAVKHELIDGCVYAMAGASANHERIAGNIYSEFRNHLKGSPCEPFGSDMKVKVGSNFFYPDVSVACHFDESKPYFTDTPVIIVEVLSKATRKMDESLKLLEYINLPSLQEYVLIEQDYVDIQVIRRCESWLPRHYFLGDDITFEAIGLTLPVEDIYARVHNDDILEFLNHNAQQNSDPKV
jgi:Uma2 family endonuclease